ncbi:MAG: alanine--glyoxylate aminotransferase family protein [Chloroflexi bacterium]|nr:alanine--glyoxylate aminotransferase family protein [Chloroflexota bacterium]
MKNYKIPMVPGPVKINPIAFPSLTADFGAGYSEDEFFELYKTVSEKLAQLMGTSSEVIIQSGEAMSILWGSVKSTLLPGDTLLAISTGFFGEGFAAMACAVNARGELLAYPYDETIHDLDRIETAIKNIKPKVITAVHCETPSGTLNPLKDLGFLKDKYQVPLLLVDAVASVGCTPVNGDEWHADIVMGGSQKGLSLPPTIGFCSVSERAWEIIDQVNYQGYEAFKPFRQLATTREHPNTPDWNGIAALNDVLDALMVTEGLPNVFARHEQVASFIRNYLTEVGYRLFPAQNAVPSPSVTCLYLPNYTTFEAFNAKVRKQGMGIAGSFGKIEGKVFRLGHMGTQATMENANQAVKVLESVL